MTNIDEELKKKQQEFAEIDSAVDKKNAEYIKLVELIDEKKSDIENINEKRVIAKQNLDKINKEIEEQTSKKMDVDNYFFEEKNKIDEYRKNEENNILTKREGLSKKISEFNVGYLSKIEDLNRWQLLLSEETEKFNTEKKLLYSDFDKKVQDITEREKNLAIREDELNIHEAELDAKQIELDDVLAATYRQHKRNSDEWESMVREKNAILTLRKEEQIKIDALMQNAESHLETTRILAKKEYDEIMDGLKEQQEEINLKTSELEKLKSVLDNTRDELEKGLKELDEKQEECESKLLIVEQMAKNIVDKENGIDAQKKQLDREIVRYIKLREDLEDKINK